MFCNLSEQNSFLNEVNITSKIRGPGEYKYYYQGENHSETDKSFLVFSRMWYSKKTIDKTYNLITSTYNSRHTAILFLDQKENLYKIFVYKNLIDHQNENMSLKLIHIIHIEPIKKSSFITDREYENKIINIRIFLVANKYIILNEINYRILLIDMKTGNYTTLFKRIDIERITLYNVLDTYDELYLFNGEEKIRTYVFISSKSFERKTASYECYYFIIQKEIDYNENLNIDLHQLNFGLGFSEPLGIKVAKINHKSKINGKEENKSFYILCYISIDKIFQLVTDYDTINLHKKIKRIAAFVKDAVFKKENVNNVDKKDNIDKFLVETGKEKIWVNIRGNNLPKNQICQNMKISLNISTKTLCAFILYFEAKFIVSYFFNYFDKPKDVKEKIFDKNNQRIQLNDKNEEDFFSDARIYKFSDCYLFKDNCFFGFDHKNFIIGENNIVHIYSENPNVPVYTYQFYEENICLLMIFNDLGSVFLLTANKLFKFIYKNRYKIFSNDKIFNENNNISIFESEKINKNETINYPIFEYKPEDMWNAYIKVINNEVGNNFENYVKKK